MEAYKVKRVLVWLFGLCLLAAPAWASVTANSVITAQTPNNGKLSFGLTASCTGSHTPYSACTGSTAGSIAGTYYTLYTAGANGSKCFGIAMSNNDPSATHVVTVADTNGTTVFHLVSLTSVSPASGSYSTANLTLSTNWAGLPVDSDGNPYFFLPSGDTLEATYATAFTSGDELDLFANCADF